METKAISTEKQPGWDLSRILSNSLVADNLMIDIEAIGIRPGSVVTSVGACMFNLSTGEVEDVFKVNIDISSSIKYGLKVDGKTLGFWFSQSKEAQDAMLKDPVPLPEACKGLIKFCQSHHVDLAWANGAPYDFPMIEAVFDSCGAWFPILHKKVMCMRPLRALVGYKAPPEYFDEGKWMHHDALDDCRRQVQMLHDMVMILRGLRGD
jgi:hypothetical protein